MRKVAILLGTWAHRRSTITWKNLEPRYHPIVFAGKQCYAPSDLELETRRLVSVRDVVKRIPKVRGKFGWGSDQYMFGLDAALSDMDLIFSSSPTCLFSYQGARHSDRTRKPFVLQEFENVPFLDADRGIYKYRKYALDKATLIAPATERAGVCLRLEGVPKEKIRTVPLGIDTDFFYPRSEHGAMRKELGIAEDEKVVLFTGRAIWEKGILDFVHAAKLLTEVPEVAKMKVRYLIVGKGEMMSAVEARVQRLGLQDKVMLAPFIPFDMMPDLYTSVDMLVAPSAPVPGWQEQWGLVLSEAMACGVPVISSLSGCIPEVVGDAGLLTQPSDALSLANAIERLLCDAELRKELSEAACARVHDLYNWRKVGDLWADFFDEACGV